MSEGSVPDAYGWMGVGLALIAAGVLTLVNGFFAVFSPFTMAIGLMLSGLIFFKVGQAHEKETLRGDVDGAK